MTAHVGNDDELVVLEILEKQCTLLFYGFNAICIKINIRNTVGEA